MPLFWISLAFLAGICFSANVAVTIYGWLIIGIVPMISLIPPVYHYWSGHIPARLVSLNQQARISTVALYPFLLVFFSLGAIRYQMVQPVINPSFLAYYNDRDGEITIEGVLVDPPDFRDTYTNIRVKAQWLQLKDESQSLPVRGLLLARISQGSTLRYGDRIRLQGKLVTPPENEDFSYRDYLARQSVYSMVSSPRITLLQVDQGSQFYSRLYSFRESALNLVYRLYPDPDASLVAGIVLGVESGISEQVYDAFRQTGTSHIIVISGFNISIIAFMLTKGFNRLFGRYKGAIATAFGIAVYTLLVGANAAVVRAAILGMFALGSQLIGRRQTGLNSLAIAGAGMAVFTPMVLWDVSFQLSFAATLGIMVYAEPFTQWFIRKASELLTQEKAEKLAGPVGEYFLITLAAQLTTLPLLLYYFKRLSLTTVIANPLILPAQPALMVLGGLSVLSGLIFKPLGQLFAWAALPFTAYTFRMVEWLAKIPHSSIALGRVALTLLVLFYLVLILLTFFRPQIAQYSSNLKPVYAFTTLAIVTFLVWKAALYAPDGLMHITFPDTGSGDAVLIQSPAGRYVLINGGPSTLQLSDFLGRWLPPFQRSLDWLIVGDIDEPDVSGLPGNLERFPPKNVLWAGNSYATYSSTRLWSALQSTSSPIILMQTGQSLDLGSGAQLLVLSSSERGGVMLLSWDHFRLLLPLGMDFDSQEAVLNTLAMRNISAVLLAESGYGPLNSTKFISFLHPQLAVLSVAPADRKGLPSPETLDALEGYPLLRTDVSGWIEITTDGQQMWVEVEKK